MDVDRLVNPDVSAKWAACWAEMYDAPSETDRLRAYDRHRPLIEAAIRADVHKQAAPLRAAAQELIDRWLVPSLTNAMAFDDAVKALRSALVTSEPS